VETKYETKGENTNDVIGSRFSHLALMLMCSDMDGGAVIRQLTTRGN
jgi:hypothetical protein